MRPQPAWASPSQWQAVPTRRAPPPWRPAPVAPAFRAGPPAASWPRRPAQPPPTPPSPARPPCYAMLCYDILYRTVL